MGAEPLYTPLFCEENIWQLARQMLDDGGDPDTLWVLFFSNPRQTVLMLNQYRAGPQGYIAWDYHVVLQAGDLLYDLDTILPFPVNAVRYFSESFPVQSALDESYRGWVRRIPASSFVERFYSDRSHMQDSVAKSEYPSWPAITPANPDAIALKDYWNMHKVLDDGSRVMRVEEYVRLLRP
jgi:hypothetical protein